MNRHIRSRSIILALSPERHLLGLRGVCHRERNKVDALGRVHRFDSCPVHLADLADIYRERTGGRQFSADRVTPVLSLRGLI